MHPREDDEKIKATSEILSILSIEEHGQDKSLTADDLTNMVLDRHGTGRVLFRNVRKSVKGFPNRVLKTYPLESPEVYRQFDDALP